MKLKNKTAIITGGSRGIGKTVAEYFAREGAQVFVLARDRSEIAAAVREIAETTSQTIEGMVCDISDKKMTTKIISKIGKRMRHIDVLVNCAGIQSPIGFFGENKIEDWEKNISVNLFGPVHAIKAALPFMAKPRKGTDMHGRGGSIINFSGGGATSLRPNFSAYAVAKAGIVKLTEILAGELAPYHIRVNAIAPGAVNTFMLAEVLKAGAQAGKKELAAAKKRFTEGGVSPEIPAALAVFLASHDAAGLTGRLVSAPWDDWQNWDKKVIRNMEPDALKLRRVSIKKL